VAKEVWFKEAEKGIPFVGTIQKLQGLPLKIDFWYTPSKTDWGIS